MYISSMTVSVSLCSDTVSRSGMFCTIATTIERCKTEGVVDVFQVVKALRVQKPGAVRTVVCTVIMISCCCYYMKKFHFRCSTGLFSMQFWCSWTHSILMQTFSIQLACALDCSRGMRALSCMNFDPKYFAVRCMYNKAYGDRCSCCFAGIMLDNIVCGRYCTTWMR